MVQSRANISLDLHLKLDPRRVRESLERALRGGVADGRLAPGSALPPSRALAADLGIDRTTVTEAYAQLVAEGWLVARQGSATRVAPRPSLARAAPAERPEQVASCRYDLRAGFPDLTSFPRQEWLSAARAALADAPAETLGYGPPAGLSALREALAGYLGRARGVHARPDRVVVCAGFTAGLGLVATALRERGVRSIGVEQFGHASHRAILEAAGLKVVPLDVDDEGAVPDHLTGLGAVLLTPAHQFPLGVALSARRRAAFTAWAARTGAIVIEDDYDGEFRYDRRALGAVQALSPDQVVYAGTASKTLTPGLRLGWLVLPERLVTPVLDRQLDGHAQPAAIEQLTLAEFIDSGRYDRHIRRTRLVYRRRRDRLVTGLARRAPQLRVSGMSAGLHASVSLPNAAAEDAVVERARSRDLAIGSLGSFSAVDTPTRHGLVIGYATPPPHAYTTALARLFAALR
jgi:GntR family transcriptional regulator / MocR family aminotransferase